MRLRGEPNPSPVNLRQPLPRAGAFGSFFARLALDRAGNTLALVAAGIIPILAMVGSGVDMGRSYLSQSRLQQACDAGVLAARKRLGTEAAVNGTVPNDVAEIGQRFFNINFRSGAYGTEDRNFTMTLEPDYAISAVATVIVPTTVMRAFGFEQVPIAVNCEAQLNSPNIDVMLVLDTTGSMAEMIPGGTETKIVALRDTVKNFYAQLEASKATGARTRYGFVPYSSNVNVGYLLKNDWMVDEETLPVRYAVNPVSDLSNYLSDLTITPISGTATPVASSTASKCPESTGTWTDLSLSTANNGDQQGTAQVDGTFYTCTYNAMTSKYTVNGVTYDKYVFDWVRPQSNGKYKTQSWSYTDVTVDVSPLKGKDGDLPYAENTADDPITLDASNDQFGLLSAFDGCIQERKTYEIGDYSNVDIANALDLDIDRVPDPSDPDTQWRPLLDEFFVQRLNGNGSGNLDKQLFKHPENYYTELLPLPTCPARARKLASMTAQEVSDYVDTLYPQGTTYHDIGMIWGGRLLSPTGIFADENADPPSGPVARHLIFLTDGETHTDYNNYATYGIEAYEQRRWGLNSPETLNTVVENRFTVACNEVKKKNITVWVIGFGTTLKPFMTDCAGDGHYFEVSSADGLNQAFSKIAKQMGELRLDK